VPFFFIVPLWLLLSICGTALLFSPRLRFLTPYIVLGSTVGLMCSVAFSTVVLLLMGKILGGTSVAWLALAAYLMAIVVGGGVGVIAGLLLGQEVNRRLGWSSR
jgi:thiamine transporter ThiT